MNSQDNFGEESGSKTCLIKYFSIKKAMMVLAQGIDIEMNEKEQKLRNNLHM